MKRYIAVLLALALMLMSVPAALALGEQFVGQWKMSYTYSMKTAATENVGPEWDDFLLEITPDMMANVTRNGETHTYPLKYDTGYFYMIVGEEWYRLGEGQMGLCFTEGELIWSLARVDGGVQPEADPFLTEDGFRFEILEDGTARITDYEGNEDEVVIPAAIGEYTVTAIGDHAFGGGYMRAVEIPETITSIGRGAFAHCLYLETLNIPDGVTEIGENLAENSESLASVTIPGSVTVVPEAAFANCAVLTEIVLGEGIMEIGGGAFSGCESLETIVLPDGLESLGHAVFMSDPNLKEVRIPSSVAKVGQSLFDGNYGAIRGEAGSIAEKLANSFGMDFIAE